MTTDTKTDGSVSGGASTGGSMSTETSVSGTPSGTLSTDSPSARPKMDDDKDKLDAEKKTGLDPEQKDSSSASPAEEKK